MGNYERNFGGVIWTNHALQRLQERGIKQGDAWATWRKPDQSRYAQSQSAWVYYRTWGSDRIEVVAKQNDRKQWVILSVWSKRLETPKRAPRSEKPSLLSRLLAKLFRT